MLSIVILVTKGGEIEKYEFSELQMILCKNYKVKEKQIRYGIYGKHLVSV